MSFVCMPWRPEEDTRTPETGVLDDCELSCRCWHSNSTPMQEQQMFLTTEPSLFPIFKIHSSDGHLGGLCNSGSCDWCCNKQVYGYLFDAMTLYTQESGCWVIKFFEGPLYCSYKSYTMLLLSFFLSSLPTIYHYPFCKSQASSYTNLTNLQKQKSGYRKIKILLWQGLC